MEKNNLITNFISLITIAWLLLFLFIWLAPINYFFEIGKIHLDFKAINLGELGSLISGIFAPLAFLWLFQNFKQQDENLKIAQKQLKILIEERENRRRVKKAYFRPDGAQTNNQGTYILSFKPRNPAFNINIELVAPEENLKILIHNKYHEDYIYPSEILEITLHTSLQDDDLKEGSHNYIMYITYLDEDGFDSREVFYVTYDARIKYFLAMSTTNYDDQPFKTKINVL